MARPTKYSQELADQICDLIMTTDKGLRIIAVELKISTTSILKWLNEDEKFAIQYARAREIQADFLADQIIEIADETHSDTSVNEDGHEVVNHEVIARSRLRVDARKWKASKLYPKKYADRLDTDVTTKGESINLPPFMRANASKS